MSRFLDFRYFFRVYLVPACLMLFLLASVAAAGDDKNPKALPDYDIAGGLMIEAAPRAALKPGQKAKLVELETVTVRNLREFAEPCAAQPFK